MSSSVARADDRFDAEERPAKRVKLDIDQGEPKTAGETEDLLPPSSRLFRAQRERSDRVQEQDVGITEYVCKDVPALDGIIKQRFTDFLVFEVDRTGTVIHLQDIQKPVDIKQPEPEVTPTESPNEGVASSDLTADGIWHSEFDEILGPFLSDTTRASLKKLYEEGIEPPFVADGGWGQRMALKDHPVASTPEAAEVKETTVDAGPAQGRGRRGERGGRGRGRGNGRDGGRIGGPLKREDTRVVTSDVIDSKEQRTALHGAIRATFHNKLETETSDGNKIAIRWSHSKQKGAPRGKTKNGQKLPPFIHFTMHKTNRDTHDAISHLSRMLKQPAKDFGVAGTKDKRGVTTQRVSVRTLGRSLSTFWRMINNIPSRRTEAQAMSSRAERGVRVGDIVYASEALDLGMLSGNAFVITLRNVKAESSDAIDKAMNSILNRGFVNYYGMQRFGTAAVPTHAIGLALLKSDWHRAIALVLRPRSGEHEDIEAGRKAWLEDGDLNRALELLPRRVVAERCILESFKRNGGDTRNAMGALATIPRNLRMMYTHAYQSYVWNTVVSERIRRFGAEKPVVGDLVYDLAIEATGEAGLLDVADELEMENDAVEEENAPTAAEGSASSPGKKPWVAPSVKVLAASDTDKYSIFDVIMPLPGKDMIYPGGVLGELYQTILQADGLGEEQLHRVNKEYSLLGSYRKILQLPRNISWTQLRYTDPDAALVQADEDILIGLDPPKIEEDGKFQALQIRLELSTASYATMALREVTKTDTSSHHQSELTKNAEDQKHRQSGGAEPTRMDVDAQDDI
ncbi:tRNA pseudouridine synthase D [Auriculariales sp. MPI-PUGE-AT-0066]|nr:tRNA pseudouridine synthase D [Auriculariales sp. MPI-PUGE-AT-0066]